MPFVDLDTNLPQNSLPEDFADKLCEATASILGKPRDRITLTVKTGSTILVGGSSAPCAQMVISSIGVVCSAEQNKEHSAKFFEFLTRELNLEQDRIRLRFIPIEAWQVGVKGTVMTYL